MDNKVLVCAYRQCKYSEKCITAAMKCTNNRLVDESLSIQPKQERIKERERVTSVCYSTGRIQ